MTAHSEDWMSIAEQASKEMDSAKLISLVQQLCSALDAQDRKKAASPLTGQTNP
jgi:hypothetical protein